MNPAIPHLTSNPNAAAQSSQQPNGQAHGVQAVDTNLKNVCATPNYARVLTKKSTEAPSRKRPALAELPAPPKQNIRTLKQVANELIDGGYTPKTTLRFISDVGDHLLQRAASPTPKEPVGTRPATPNATQSSREASVHPPILSDSVIQAQSARIDLARWGFTPMTLARLTPGEPLVPMRDVVAKWRTWAEGCGISPTFITLVISLGMHQNTLVDTLAQLNRFAALPFTNRGGRVDFSLSNELFVFSAPANGIYLQLRGYEVSLLLGKPSGLSVLWTAASTWPILSRIMPSFALLCQLCDSQQGVDRLTALCQLAPELNAVNFSPDHLNILLMAPYADQKLQYANAYKALFASKAMTPEEFIQLSFDTRIGLTELMCTLMERSGRLVCPPATGR